MPWWQAVVSQLAAFFAFPHLWMSALLLMFLVQRCLQVKNWPTEGQLIELLAYGAGVWGGVTLFRLATHPPRELADSGWSLVTGGAVLSYSAARGAMRVVKSIQPEPDFDPSFYEEAVDEDPTPPEPESSLGAQPAAASSVEAGSIVAPKQAPPN